jgi:hypothetical protein
MSGISSVRVGRSDHHYFRWPRRSQSQLLRERIKALRNTGMVPSETIQRNAAGLPFFASAWGVQKWPR